MTPGLATQRGGRGPAIENSPGFLLWQVTNRWQAAQRAALRPFDLTHVQFVLLASLCWLATDQPVTQRKLATHAAADAMMTSQVLRTLEGNGYVTRTASAADKRAMLVNVTPAGRELANRANAAVEECDARFFAALGKEEQALTELLGKLAAQPH
jgi:DNA-binding MarR family transcriptional regulator